MKKLLFSVLAFTASCSALAGGPDTVIAVPAANFSGLYAGIGGGAVFGDSNITSNTGVINTQGITPIYSLNGITNNGQSAHSTNAIGNVFVGYGFNFSRIYLSGEIYGSMSKVRASQSITATGQVPTGGTDTLSNNTRSRLNNGEIGLDFRPGFILASNTLLYGRIGAAFNKIQFNSSSIAAQNGINVINTVANYNKSQTEAGLRLGAGIEQMITTNLSLRGDYIYTNYRSISGSGIAPLGTPFTGSTLLNNTNVKVRTNTVMASLSYYLSNVI